jgi:DNA-binding XRE family transcriptional regulator
VEFKLIEQKGIKFPMEALKDVQSLKTLGESIKRKRHQLGYRQADLAELCGITDRTLREVEAGSGKPKIETWFKLGQVLGLDLVFLQKPINHTSS